MRNFTLEDYPKIKSGFIIPDNYFDTFSDTLMSQLPQKETKVSSLFRTKKKAFYAIAAVILISISTALFYKLNDLSEINDATIENYLAYNTTISEHELANLLNETDLEKIKSELKIENQVIEHELVEDINLENYLNQ